MARRCEDRFITILLSLRGSAAWSARGIDCDAGSGDRIENGHGQSSPVQADGERRARSFDQGHLGLWLRDGYCTGTLPIQSSRGVDEPPRLPWMRVLIHPAQADQPEHGRASMVNGCLMKPCPAMRWATVDGKMEQTEAAEAGCNARLLRFIEKLSRR